MHLSRCTDTVEHVQRRGIAGVVALLVVFAACGRGPDADSRRVIASPVPSASVDPTKAPRTAAPEDDVVRATDAPTVTRLRSSPPPADPATLAEAKIKLTKIATVTEPTAMAIRRADPAFYIAGRHTGEVRPVRGGQVGAPVVDVGGEISTGGEQGLLGLAFSPDGTKLYINFTTKTSTTAGNVADTVIREYEFDGDASSPREVLRIPQPATNHNGGNILFGRDGYLYIGMGDGGGAAGNKGQDLSILLGKMLRIDPDPGDPDCGDGDYGIPAGNPFTGKSGCDEIWAYGLRNPWRFSFDRTTGALWTGDVGQNAWEEINVATGSSDGGENYGWPRMEGNHTYSGETPSNHHGPIYEYSHDGGNCSVTGGYVYRGSKIPALRGAYVFADYCAGRLRGFVNSGGRALGHRFLGPQVGSLSSFGQDRDGELYVLSLDGGFYRIDPA